MTRLAPVGAALVVTMAAACGPVVQRTDVTGGRPFAFPADAFAFANGVHWHYVVDPATGARVFTQAEPPPRFALHCSGMARAARQFLLHARFDPSAPTAADATYAALVRRVLATDPRALDPQPAPIVIPGYADLRAFSRAQEPFLKDVLLRDWRSVLPREDWRLIIPTRPAGQAATAAELARALEAGRHPLVRVFRHPDRTLNHALLLVGVARGDAEIRFAAYDPNDAAALVDLRWDDTARTFRFPETAYFAGGPVKVYGIYEPGFP